MRILLLARSFNSLTQRLYVELAARGHQLAVEFDIADTVTEEAAAMFQPEVIVAPFMRRAIPAAVWRRHICLVVHPGPAGDRGPSALDWAIVDEALQGNAGAGGCFLAFACDEVWARPAVVLNPHYRNMGNLYGSEYWTYTLPRRLRQGSPHSVMANRLPIGAPQAVSLGLVDAVLDSDRSQFIVAAIERAAGLAAEPAFAERIAAKRRQRARDEAAKPLATYRDEELANLRRNFYGFDPSYHYARSNFVRKVPHAWTPRRLAVHREPPGRAA